MAKKSTKEQTNEKAVSLKTLTKSTVWDVQENAFNVTNSEGALADKAADEVTKAGQKDGEDIVKASVLGVVTFKDAANGDFNGKFEGSSAEPETGLGHLFWDLEFLTTGINNVETVQQDGVVYNVAGQMVTSSYKGLVIKNGKKFIQK